MKTNNHLLIVGLGNPGATYNGTRHNIGFDIIDKIADEFDFPQYSAKFSAEVSSKTINSTKITLLKPQTYMNLSGNAVAKALNFFKIPLENLIVLHDDLDLAFAKIKVKIGGGSGGHNGIKSIDQHLGSNYYRIRIGIGKPIAAYDVSDYVLAKFAPEERLIVEKLQQIIIANFASLISGDFTNFMNKIAMEFQKNGI